MTAPTITVRIAITIATIGRLMKKFDTLVPLSSRLKRFIRLTLPCGGMASA